MSNNSIFTHLKALEFAQRTLALNTPVPVDPVPTLPVEPKEHQPRLVGEIDYAKWDSLEEEAEAGKKEEEKRQFAGMCSQDHRKERELYERSTAEKLQACQVFKDQGNAAFKEKSYSLAAVNYRK